MKNITLFLLLLMSGISEQQNWVFGKMKRLNNDPVKSLAAAKQE